MKLLPDLCCPFLLLTCRCDVYTAAFCCYSDCCEVQTAIPGLTMTGLLTLFERDVWAETGCKVQNPCQWTGSAAEEVYSTDYNSSALPR